MKDSNVLKIVCSAAIQSWRASGIGSRQSYTELIPTKTAITGLISNALGYYRNDNRIDILHNSYELYLDMNKSGLNTGLKTHNELNIPQTMMDFQTVGGVKMVKSGGGYETKTSIEEKEYISGYRYVLYIKAEGSVLELIKNALIYPKRELYLGSKCCPPAEDIFQGIIEIERLEENNVYQHIRN